MIFPNRVTGKLIIDTCVVIVLQVPKSRYRTLTFSVREARQHYLIQKEKEDILDASANCRCYGLCYGNGTNFKIKLIKPS